MQSPARRVLADKNKNAPIKIRSPKPNPKSKTNASAAVLTMSVTPTSQRQIEDTIPSSSPKLGQKRKIQEVEDAERVDALQDQEQGQDQDQYQDHPSQPTQLWSESEPDDTMQMEISTSTSTSNIHQSYETADTSFTASQKPLDPHFDIQEEEEMSQRTLEKLNDVPMPQNTSQLPPPPPVLLTETSAGSVGLSTFFNFESLSSTQASDAVDSADVQSTKQTPSSEAATARKRLMDEKAAELRTRLQLAIFKVQTKQTSQPFSRLKTSRPLSSSSLDTVHVLSTPQLSSSTIKEPSSSRTLRPDGTSNDPAHSAEAQIAAIRSQAVNLSRVPLQTLHSLHVPQLDPELLTAGRSFDSNKTYRLTEVDSQDAQNFPSSPPFSRLPSASSDDGMIPLVTQAMAKQQDTQLSSPPVSEAEAIRDENLLNRVTQGEAASSLVQLMTGGSGI